MASTTNAQVTDDAPDTPDPDEATTQDTDQETGAPGSASAKDESGAGEDSNGDEPRTARAAPPRAVRKRATRKRATVAPEASAATEAGDASVPAGGEHAHEPGPGKSEPGESGAAAAHVPGESTSPPARRSRKRSTPTTAAVSAADSDRVAAEGSGSTAGDSGPSDAKTSGTTSDGRDGSDAADRVTGDDAGPAAEPPAVSTFGLLFQAPAPTVAPRRRRAQAPAGAPATERTSDSDGPGDTGRSSEDGDAPDTDTDADDAADAGDGTRRRRRRGGKGRRRTSGDGDTAGTDNGDDTSTDNGDDSGPEDDVPAEAAAETSDDDSGTGRRRTRRRRRSGSPVATDAEDPPGTVTRVREPRRQSDEATGIRGSTRLEAKRQRRREGREAGRRRTVITEAEFLARRESVARSMVVRETEDRTQIAVLEDGVLVEHYVSTDGAGGAQSGSIAGNVYLGRVQNVLPSMEAAFVDIGRGRNAVLYAGEVNWDAAGLEQISTRRIENALRSGQSVLVQVTKDPIGHKGARLTSQVSLPGRYLVYVPNGNMTGISRKLPDTERARLKKILREVVPEQAGVIVRTAAEGASEAELRADVERLTRTWEAIQKKAASGQAPMLLHGEPDLTVRVVRDVFNEDFTSLVVAGDRAWSTVREYVDSVAPDLAPRLSKWTGEKDVFAANRVDEQLAKALDRKVWLPSGGSLVIDRTEAMTVIDVNTGKFTGSGGNLEETVTKNNIEAAEEIVRQLRLRDIGGIVVIDFIDMVLEANRDLVIRRLLECLGRDRTKHQVAEVTSLGLVQMTRKRVGAGLLEVFSEPCAVCNGRGIVVHHEPILRGASGADSSGSGGSGSGSRGRSRRSRGGASGNGGGSNGQNGQNGPNGRAGQDGHHDDGAGTTPAKPSGPTPAQMAAAAYAAAVEAHAHEPNVTHPPDSPGDVPAPAEDISAVGASMEPEEDESAFHLMEPTSPGAGEDGDAAAADASASGRRRKRGRVVAAAGPPGATPVELVVGPASDSIGAASPDENADARTAVPEHSGEGDPQPDFESGQETAAETGAATRPGEMDAETGPEFESEADSAAGPGSDAETDSETDSETTGSSDPESAVEEMASGDLGASSSVQ